MGSSATSGLYSGSTSFAGGASSTTALKPPPAQSTASTFKPSISAVDQMGQNKYTSSISAMGARSSSNSNLGNSAASLRSPIRSQAGSTTKFDAAGQFSASSAQNKISFSAK